MPKVPQALIYGLDAPEPEEVRELNAAPLPSGSELKPWDKQAGEDLKWYERFLYYLKLGTDRSMKQAAREYLIVHHKLLPGEPVPVNTVYAWYAESVHWSWLLRARYWDRENLQELQMAIEEGRHKRIQEMAEEHLAGWEAFQTVAIRSIYLKDDNGNLVLDENGQPKFKEIEDVGIAARVFEKAIRGKRVEMGLPNDLVALAAPQLIERYQQLLSENAQLESGDNDTIDGEYKEADSA